MKQRMRYWGNLLLLVLWCGVCHARPQARNTNTDADSPVASSGGGARLSNEERAFFAPGSWQPIPNQVSGLIIDEAPSRVRLEKYDTSIRDARSKEETVETPVVMATNTTGNTTTRGKSPTPLGDAIKMVASQLMQSRGGVAESDVRAPPPKLKTQQQKIVDTGETSHQGVAIPVIIEDTEHMLASMTKATPTTTTRKSTTQTPTKKIHGTTIVYEKKTQSTPTLKNKQSTTKRPTAASLRDPVTSIPDGLTTWVFLSGSSATTLLATTPSPTISTKLSTKPMTGASTTKKTQRITTTVATPSEKTHNVVKKPSPLFTSSGTKPNRMTKKPVAAAVEESVTISLSNKNKNKEAVSSSTENKDKPTASRLEGEKLETIAFRRRPVSSEIEATPSTTTTFKPLPTAYPLSTIATDEGSAETSSEDESTEVAIEETTKRTRQPGEKKKKKNKNKRRRRPVVKPQEEEDSDEIESKIEGDEEEGGVTKVPVKNGKPARPLTTRIYNFLAREIMPTVGVGLIGLVGLAGLAGLIMYPFGGGALPIRRNYEEAPKPNYYYYENDEGGQSEEEVLGKVLAGMKDPSYVVGEQQQSYQEPEGRKPIQGEAYTRYDVGGRIANHKETQQPIRNDYDVAGRISSGAAQNHDAQQQQTYESEVGSRISGSVRVGGDYESDVSSRIVPGQNKEVVIQGSVHKDDTHYGSEVAARNPVQNRGSQRVGESEPVAAPQASALYATRNEPRPVFNNDWSMVKTDAQEAVSLSNNNNHELKYGGGGDVDAIYGQSAQREERLRYDTVQSPQYSGVSRVGVGQKRTVNVVEHGPRRLKRDVIKKDSAKEDLEENEIVGLEVSDDPVFTVQRVEIVDNDDEEAKEKTTKAPKKDLGISLKKTTPTKLEVVDMETTTFGKTVTEATTFGKTVTEVTTDSSEGFTDNSSEEYSDEKIDSGESTTRVIVKKNNDVIENGKDETTSLPSDATTVTEENITLETESPEDPSLIGLIRRVAQYKIRLGLSFLRNTSQAFSRYLEGMQKRVENIVKENAKNRSKLQNRKTAHEDDYY